MMNMAEFIFFGGTDLQFTERHRYSSSFHGLWQILSYLQKCQKTLAYDFSENTKETREDWVKIIEAQKIEVMLKTSVRL